MWDVWTRPEHFAVWFGTDAMPMEDVDLDVRPGGAWRGTMVVPGDRRIQWHGTFREVVAPERLVMSLDDGTGAPDEDEFYTVTLTDLGQRTEMSVRQWGGHLSDEEYEHAEAGTNSFLDTMSDLLAKELKARHEAH